MMNFLPKYLAGCYVYGVARNFAYVTPLKKDEYIVDRAQNIGMAVAITPLIWPALFFRDLKNIEHIVRKMPGPINRGI
jgi:hypothetical protein